MIAANTLNAVLTHLKNTFVGKDEIADLLGVCLVAKENAFLLGPPGTAKSAIVRQLSACIEGGKNFEYLLTRFTEPNEIFGPFDIRRLKDGELVTNTEGMMPEASLVFLDEIFNANSAILNSLLMALNEKVFRRGKETIRLPALMFVGASNAMPEEEALAALLDRFLVRVKSENVDPELLDVVLTAGWKLENDQLATPPSITPAEIQTLQRQCRQVDLSPIRKAYVDLVHHLRTTGIRVSDRRAVKVQNLLAASALLAGRTAANLSDLWVMKHIWDTEEQIEILAGIVGRVIEKDESPLPHPQATVNRAPNAEGLAREVQALREKWESGKLSFEEKNLVKDKLRYVQTRAGWVSHSPQKDFLNSQIEALWQTILQTA
ncbi:MAG: AAA family ATPase [Saprospiraceae bacterium]